MPFIFFSDRDIKHHEDTGHGFCPICECCIGCDCCVCGKEDSDDEETYEYVRPTPDNLDELYTEEEQMKIYEALKAKFQQEEDKVEEEEVTTTTTTTTEIFKGTFPELLKAAYPTNPFTWTLLTKEELRQKVPHLCPPRTEEESEEC